MEERTSDCEALNKRIQQLEHECDELHKDIEQLCLQQSGSSYLAAATRMHFQRTASLEQEIENLKKKLAICMRENQNLQEELSEVYRIKSQLADLHSAELSKNMEAEKQLTFFQNCVASAFAERDNSIMEAEKAKEREEALSKELGEFQQRLEELTAKCNEEKERNSSLRDQVMKLEKKSQASEMLINKFYEIRQNSIGCFDVKSVEEKHTRLLDDLPEMWTFDCHAENTASKYIASLEEESASLRNSMENLHRKLRMGLEIEEHLRKKVSMMEEKIICSDRLIRSELSKLRCFHTQHRCEIVNLLEYEKSHIEALFAEANLKIEQFQTIETCNYVAHQADAVSDDIVCRDVHITNDVDPTLLHKDDSLASSRMFTDRMVDTSDALLQAKREKVAALLLLSQQEERHLLERDVNAALQNKVDELQKNLSQVTTEKVKALMELAQLKQDYQKLRENIGYSMKQGCSADDVEKSVITHEKDGKLKNLLKRTALRRWVGRFDPLGSESTMAVNNDESSSARKKVDIHAEFARLRIENATLQESISSMEHLTSSIHKLRLSLLKAKDAATSESPANNLLEALDNIISEANVVRTALNSSLPLSWSAVTGPASPNRHIGELCVHFGDSNNEKIDYVSAAGFEMVELLLLAAYLLRDAVISKSCQSEIRFLDP